DRQQQRLHGVVQHVAEADRDQHRQRGLFRRLVVVSMVRRQAGIAHGSALELKTGCQDIPAVILPACETGPFTFSNGPSTLSPMVRNAGPSRIYEDTPRPVVAVGNDYPPDHEVAPHQHRRYQLLYGARGVMMVWTEHGAWVVPPAQGVWIPFGVRHSVRTIGPVTTNSIFIEPDAIAGMPSSCSVLGISPLMRSLLLEAVDVPLEYAVEGRGGMDMAL